ncbi:hypothetical protein J5X84_35235 [Streptosporangiaceae bacterium NEAU-GS5]|nr:hypothetical protein [Streptosporangiaceae bacterium NEAU-GS5]
MIGGTAQVKARSGVRIAADYRSARAGVTALAWGQRAIWKAIQDAGRDNAHYFNVTRLLAVPKTGGPRDPETVADALGQIMERHDALRARLRPGEFGPGQEIEAAGTLMIDVVEGDGSDPDADAEDLLARLAGVSFGPGEPPIRAGLVVRDGAVRHVALVFCHVAADRHAADVVVRDLRMLLLRGELPPPPSYQLLDLVREQTMGPRLRSARAIAHWEEAYRRIPPVMFPDQVGPGGSPRFAKAMLASPALDDAVRVVAARAHVSTATVLLVAATQLLAATTGHQVCAVTPIVHNRFQPRTRDLVTSLNQLGLFTLENGAAAPLGETLATAYPAVLAAYRHAQYDQVAWEAMVDRVSAGRRVRVFPSCCFNDLRPGEEIGSSPSQGDSVLEWQPGVDHLNCGFCMSLNRWNGTLAVGLSADTTRLPERDMAALLGGIESYVVAAAHRSALPGEFV